MQRDNLDSPLDATQQFEISLFSCYASYNIILRIISVSVIVDHCRHLNIDYDVNSWLENYDLYSDCKLRSLYSVGIKSILYEYMIRS